MPQHPKFDSLNGFLDRWRWVMAIAGVLTVMGASVAWPGTRITKLERRSDLQQAQLEKTTGYMRLLATATCLKEQGTQNNTLLFQMCQRVLTDPTVFELPR